VKVFKNKNGELVRYDTRFLDKIDNKLFYEIIPYIEQPPQNNFSIEIIYNNDPITQSYANSHFYNTCIQDMKKYFEKAVTGLRYSNEKRNLKIKIYFGQLMPGIIGQAGPGNTADVETNFDFTKIIEAIDIIDLCSNDRYMTPMEASIKFSSNHFNPNNPNESFFNLAIHECLHALGLGALWNADFRIVESLPFLGVITLPRLLDQRFLIDLFSNLPGIGNLIPGFNDFITVLNSNIGRRLNGRTNFIGTGNTNNPFYTANIGRQAYRETMNQTGNIPIHPTLDQNVTMVNAGGSALSHWAQRTDIRDNRGRQLSTEIFTSSSFINSWMSKFTIASLEDIGYTVDYSVLDKDLYEYRSV